MGGEFTVADETAEDGEGGVGVAAYGVAGAAGARLQVEGGICCGGREGEGREGEGGGEGGEVYVGRCLIGEW